MKPIRVAIIGGGCAGMTTAFELTRPELGGRYEVTVYQQGWRLGGKGASGRGIHGRIEEHGLHVWMGFYENAFKLVQDAYRELDRDPSRCPIASWSDAFSPASEIGVAKAARSSDWSVWSTVFPPLAGLPGDGVSPSADDRSQPFSLRGYVHRVIEVLFALAQVAAGPSSKDRSPAPRDLERGPKGLRAAAVGYVDAHVAMVQHQLETLARILADSALAGSETLTTIVRGIVGALDAIRFRERDDLHRRRAAEVLEVLAVSVVGCLREGVFRDADGFDAIDGYDFREFLQHHGASDAAVSSPFVHGLYSLMFAYEGGDAARPRTAAGQALRGCLRMFFTYRGSLFWKMAAGMGDVVFGPLYEVLARRGVRFEFFHRLTNIGLGAVANSGPPHVSQLDFDVQARPKGVFSPLVDIGGVPSWPSEPDWSQLVDGDEHRRQRRDFESDDPFRVASRKLHVQRDFDLVCLAVGLGEVPAVCKSIIETNGRWRRMIEHVQTVATHAMQLWMRVPMRELGWEKGPVTITAFVSPFDTWADMTHLIGREQWPSTTQPEAVAYFCNVLDEREIRRRDAATPMSDHVRRLGEAFVADRLPSLWPRLLGADGHLRSDVFVSPFGDVPNSETGLGGQYYRANTSRSERYTLSLPGTPQYRISPLDRTYDNFTIAGDWTSCGLNLGCVESAVMSGMLAAHALSGFPALDDIVGYDHL